MASKPSAKKDFDKASSRKALVAAFESDNAADIVTQLRHLDKNDATGKLRSTINERMARMLDKHDDYGLYIDVVAKAKKADIKLSVAPLTKYMEDLLKKDDYKTFLDVYEKGKKADLKLLNRTMKNMLKGDLEALAATNKDKEFFDLHEQLRSKGIKIVSSKISHHMTAKLTELAGEGKYKEFFKLYERMQTSNIKPEKAVLAEAVQDRMKHHLAEGDYEQFFTLHADLREHGIKFDKNKIAAAVESQLMEHIRAGDRLAEKDNKFFDLYAEAKEARIKPDMKHIQEKLNTQLAQFVKEGNSSGFRDLLALTAANRIKTDLSFVEFPEDFDLKGTNLRYTTINDINRLTHAFNAEATLSASQKFTVRAGQAVDLAGEGINAVADAVAGVISPTRNALTPAA